MKTISEIKAELGIGTISFIEQLNKEGVSTGWGKHWQDDTRVSVIIPIDVHTKLAKDPAGYAMVMRVEENVQPEDKTKKPYTLVTLFEPKNVLGSY